MVDIFNGFNLEYKLDILKGLEYMYFIHSKPMIYFFLFFLASEKVQFHS